MSDLRAILRVLATLLLCVQFRAADAAPPPEVSLDDFRARVHEWFSRHARDSSLERLRNAEASAELRELRWQLQELLNRGEPLSGFEDVGIRARENGRSVEFDLKRFPQWLGLERDLAALAEPELFRFSAPGMRNSGLSDRDLAAIAAYMTNNDLGAKRHALLASIVRTYSKIVDADEASARALARDYMYEALRGHYDVEYQWAIGLIDSLDIERQALLAAYFDKVIRESSSAMGADGSPETLHVPIIEMFRNPKFQRYLRNEAKKYAQPRVLDYSLDARVPTEEAPDPAWSGPMQRKIELFFANHPSDRFNIVGVDCRTTYCKIKAEGAPGVESHEAFAAAISDITRRGWGLERGGGGGSSSRDGTSYEMYAELRRDSDD